MPHKSVTNVRTFKDSCAAGWCTQVMKKTSRKQRDQEPRKWISVSISLHVVLSGKWENNSSLWKWIDIHIIPGLENPFFFLSKNNKLFRMSMTGFKKHGFKRHETGWQSRLNLTSALPNLLCLKTESSKGGEAKSFFKASDHNQNSTDKFILWMPPGLHLVPFLAGDSLKSRLNPPKMTSWWSHLGLRNGFLLFTNLKNKKVGKTRFQCSAKFFRKQKHTHKVIQ